MENKEEIVARLKLLLMATRAGSNIQDLKLNEAKNKVTIVFKAGGERVVDINRRFWICNYHGCDETYLGTKKGEVLKR